MKVLRILAALFLVFGWLLLPAAASSFTPGLKVDVYVYDSSALPEHTPTYELCATETVWTTAPNISANFDYEFGGIVAGCQSDFVMVHYYGYITWPITEDVMFLSQADDGFYLSISGTTVIDDWFLKPCSGNVGTHHFEAGVSESVDVWFYEYGGGACNTLYVVDAAGTTSVVPPNVFSMEPVVIEPTPEPTPTDTPTIDPTPTDTPTVEPTQEPTAEPTIEPTVEPTPEPTQTIEPTIEPTPSESATEVVPPIVDPTPEPTTSETADPEDPVDEVVGLAVVGQAIDAFFNVGSDLPEEVRKKAKKVVVAAIIVGQVAQTATQTAAAASATASRKKEE